jgi:hypothetical protein
LNLLKYRYSRVLYIQFMLFTFTDCQLLIQRSQCLQHTFHSFFLHNVSNLCFTFLLSILHFLTSYFSFFSIIHGWKKLFMENQLRSDIVPLKFRYLAVTQPLNYSKRRRSKRLAMMMILVVWILALAITCPPILGRMSIKMIRLYECVIITHIFIELFSHRMVRTRPSRLE